MAGGCDAFDCSEDSTDQSFFFFYYSSYTTEINQNYKLSVFIYEYVIGLSISSYL